MPAPPFLGDDGIHDAGADGGRGTSTGVRTRIVDNDENDGEHEHVSPSNLDLGMDEALPSAPPRAVSMRCETLMTSRSPSEPASAVCSPAPASVTSSPRVPLGRFTERRSSSICSRLASSAVVPPLPSEALSAASPPRFRASSVSRPSSGSIGDDCRPTAERLEATLTPFTRDLAAATHKAADKASSRLVEQLCQDCLKEARLGHNIAETTATFAGERPFIESVARRFAGKVEEMDLESVEWWSGREWRQSRGRYNIVHDTMYEQYYTRLRVKWNVTPVTEDVRSRGSTSIGDQTRPFTEELVEERRSAVSVNGAAALGDTSGMQEASPQKAPSNPSVELLMTVVSEQLQDLKGWTSAQAALDERSAQAAVEAIEAERRFHEDLNSLVPSQPPPSEEGLVATDSSVMQSKQRQDASPPGGSAQLGPSALVEQPEEAPVVSSLVASTDCSLPSGRGSSGLAQVEPRPLSLPRSAPFRDTMPSTDHVTVVCL
eukprot:TRINITY_DN74238_c0_g1_i1.p1 TRINITY_DN74238_c0_g1~~TRINITY_DN74238_c0_g1_i1.p1  ORF type:complete len:490 (+),score=77.57 TRINITY_DN74238_c0_g1_i1:114-1583(+)